MCSPNINLFHIITSLINIEFSDEDLSGPKDETNTAHGQTATLRKQGSVK